MASELATEQARWTDLNLRMEALEATLGPGEPSGELTAERRRKDSGHSFSSPQRDHRIDA